MPAKTRSVKGPIISGIVIGAVLLSPTVPSIASTVTDLFNKADATSNSRQVSLEEQALNKTARDMLGDKGYHNIHLAKSVLTNPSNVHDGLTMTFNVLAPNSLVTEKKVVDCQPVKARVNPTEMLCSLRPA